MPRTRKQDTIIHTTALTRAFGKTVAVAALDLAIFRGEIFGLIGPDGAGKTTTLRMLATIIQPGSGSASVAGLDVRRDAEKIKARVGYMAQSFSLYRDLSVLENLTFFADVFGVRGPERTQRIERLLAFARLGDLRGRRAGDLSGGMQKKLGLACTLIHAPQILFLDEPTTGVDPVSRREFWDILTELHLGGATIVVSTPYMDEAERCTRIGLMHAGRLIACDTPAGIKARLAGQMLAVHPSDRRKAGAALAGAPGVREVQAHGELLHVLVDDSRGGQRAVEAALKKAGVQVHSMREIAPRVEDAFISLIRRSTPPLTDSPSPNLERGLGGEVGPGSEVHKKQSEAAR